MWNGNPYPYPYYYGYRQTNLSDLAGCLNKWVTITLTDGTVVQAYPAAFDFSQATVYVARNSIRSLTCGGTVIQNAQQAQSCMNQWAQLELPNGMRLSLLLTSYEDSYIGGTFQTSELMGLSGQVSNVQC